MLKKVLPGILFLILCVNSGYSWNIQDIQGMELTQPQLQDIMVELIIQDRLDDLQKWKRVYPQSFLDLDFTESYYKVGLSFYNKGQRMLALKSFLKGYANFELSEYKEPCGFYAAKILYQNYERESALFYINRVLRSNLKDEALRDEAQKLWRRIRWEYISRFEGIPDNSISDVEFDGDDIWIAMWTGGVGRFTRSNYSLKLFQQKEGGLISQHVRDIAILGNYVWVGTYDGLCRYNKKLSTWERMSGKLKRAKVKRMVIIENKLYAATLGDGVYVYDPLSDEWSLFFNDSVNVTDIIKVGPRFYIASLDKGLYLFDGKTSTHIIKDIPVKTLAFQNDRVWVGTYGHGIMLVSTRTTKHFMNITHEQGLSSDFVEALQPVNDKMIIGTLGGGVSVYDPEKKGFSYIRILEGLPSNDVVRITLARNRIWFGTLSGGLGILLTENYQDI